jgi:GNAT superfamily N-acetyltransferase
MQESYMTPTPPLLTATDSQLALAVEANAYDMIRTSASLLGGEYEETPYFTRALSWPTNPTFKSVWNARLTSDNVDEAIDETIAWYKARNAPYFFWWVGDDSAPVNLGERLEAHGIPPFHEPSPVMVADIDQLNWNNPYPPELKLERISTVDQLHQWKQLFIDIFAVPEFASQAWVDATQSIGIDRAPWQLLLGSVNGDPACFGFLYCGAGVAGLIGLGTLPAYRGQGIGSAMQLERLRIARELGYRYAALFASEMGYSPYLKLGFKDTGRKLRRYLWVNNG